MSSQSCISLLVLQVRVVLSKLFLPVFSNNVQFYSLLLPLTSSLSLALSVLLSVFSARASWRTPGFVQSSGATFLQLQFTVYSYNVQSIVGSICEFFFVQKSCPHASLKIRIFSQMERVTSPLSSGQARRRPPSTAYKIILSAKQTDSRLNVRTVFRPLPPNWMIALVQHQAQRRNEIPPIITP